MSKSILNLSVPLRQLRGRLGLIHPHWPAYPNGVRIILGDFNACDPERGSNVWNLSFTDGDPERLPCSTLYFHTSKIDRIFINLPMAAARDFRRSSHVVENLWKKTIPSDHAAVRLVIQKPTHRGHQNKRIPNWMSTNIPSLVLSCSNSMTTTDSDPFCALAECKVFLHKAKKMTKRELSRQNLTASVQSF